MQDRHLHIPGLDEAIAKERELRNEIYLNAPRNICGVLCNQITPQLHARLCAVKSPFLGGGNPTKRDVLSFLWLCSTEFDADSDKAEEFFLKSFEIDLVKACSEIDVFIEHTYMDCATSGKKSKPYYSMNASIEYAMASEPFRWDYDTRTQFVPLRRIFQLMNVRHKHSGGTIDNPISDSVTQEYLRAINEDEDMRAFFQFVRMSQCEPDSPSGDN